MTPTYTLILWSRYGETRRLEWDGSSFESLKAYGMHCMEAEWCSGFRVEENAA